MERASLSILVTALMQIPYTVLSIAFAARHAPIRADRAKSLDARSSLVSGDVPATRAVGGDRATGTAVLGALMGASVGGSKIVVIMV